MDKPLDSTLNLYLTISLGDSYRRGNPSVPNPGWFSLVVYNIKTWAFPYFLLLLKLN